MAQVLDDLVVVEVASGMVGSLVAMALGDYGARVFKLERPGRPALGADGPGPLVWDRNKERVEVDLVTESGRSVLADLVAEADIVIETFAPGTAARLGLDLAAFRAADARLITCSVTGYGRQGSWADRPGWDALVQARSGIAGEQPAWLRGGPAFLHTPLPSYGAFFLASIGINTALWSREVTGVGQHVETSLMQGALLWTTMLWSRAEQPTPDLTTVFRYRDLMPTPTFPTADGWFHAMPNAVAVALEYVGADDPDLDPMLSMGDHASRRRYFDAADRLFASRPRQEWLDLFWEKSVSAQPCLAPGESHTHPQVVHNRAVAEVEVPGFGPTRQLGYAYHLERDDERPPTAPSLTPVDGAVALAELRARPERPGPAKAPRSLDRPLAGLRVLDYGVALAGPFAPMVMADLGADVIKVDNISPSVGTQGGFLWAACQRGKRSIAIDLKSSQGQEISRRLIASADVVHYNMRTGVAERLGFGYEQAKAINPGIVYCHLTGYGNTGPMGTWPGVDQMGQALSGIEWEQGGAYDGGNPQWSRFGMCDAAAGLLSVLGVLQALYHRELTGEGQRVETNILNAGMMLASDVVSGGQALPARAHSDRLQRGLDPLYRFYETASGWLCLVAAHEGEWQALAKGLGRPELADDPRFADRAQRQANRAVLTAELEATLASKSAEDWFASLDDLGVPCEIVAVSPADAATSGGSTPAWFADPDAVANRWLVSNPHPVWGRLDQPGGLVDLSGSPAAVPGPPPMIGTDTRDILLELGFAPAEVDDLHAQGVVAW